MHEEILSAKKRTPRFVSWYCTAAEKKPCAWFAGLMMHEENNSTSLTIVTVCSVRKKKRFQCPKGRNRGEFLRDKNGHLVLFRDFRGSAQHQRNVFIPT
jgi:hypothetical protein